MGSESLVVYVNGEYVPKDHARISIFDVGGTSPVDLSLRAARIPCPLSLEELRA